MQLLLAQKEIQINQAMNNRATPLIVATYLGHFSTVQILLSNNKIDASIMFEEKTAAQYSESNARVPSWSFLDNGINQEGRVQCHQLFSSSFDVSARLSSLDESERETTQANDGGVVGETKSSGGVVGETQLGPALNDQLRATNKQKNPVVHHN